MKHLVPKVSRRGFLAGAAAMAAGAKARSSWAESQSSDEAASRYTLHFGQPASKWPNALPVGNGRLGAVVFGVPGVDRLQLNEESIWDGEPNRNRDNPNAGAAIPKIRELLFAGRVAEAEEMALNDVLSVPRRMPCYQTMGDLHLDFSAMGIGAETKVEEYRLQLDLDTAVATTTFAWNGVRYRREVFSSAPDQVIVVRLTASEPGKLAVRLRMDRPHSFETAQTAKDRLRLTGQALPVNDNPGLPVKEHQTGVRFYAEMRAIAEGSKARFGDVSKDPALEITGADAITLLIDCATSYRYPARTGKTSGVDADVLTGDPVAMRAAVDRNLSGAARRGYAELRTRSVADHRRYFRRAQFDLGPDPKAATPTDVRVEAMKAGNEDVHLLPIYFQFGRYMLISSSRPGTLAANLQGIWNESVDPPWGSKYTVNINTEMNYWMAESANLAECALPMFDLLAATREPGTRVAKDLYGAKGSVVHHNTDIWGDAGPIDALGGGVWAMGACWLSLHLWHHYAFTVDSRFLAERAYPALRENAVFLLDYLVRDPKTGHLASGPSCSPENAYKLPDGKSYHLCMSPTMDIAIERAVFTRLMQAALALGDAHVQADHELLERVHAALANLPPFQIAADGRLQEWPVDYKETEPGHRHISHLFGLHPEDQITPQGTPELARAVRLVLDKRLAAGGGSTGWSRSWIINCMARLGDGEASYENIRELFRQSTRPNLFDVCGLKENSPFQIDGNLGAPAGMIEMLLQSHGETPLTPPTNADGWREDWTVRLLPALPKAWPDGSFKGMRARGGVEIDVDWQGGKATRATLRSSVRRTHTVVLPQGARVASIKMNGRPTEPQYSPSGALLLKAEAGTVHEIAFV